MRHVLFAAVCASLVMFLDASLFAQEGQDGQKEVERLRAIVKAQEEKIEKLESALREAQELIKRFEDARKSADGDKQRLVKAAGKITHVKMEQKTVLIDLGAAAGLQKGDVLTVSRVGRILGKVRVSVVVDDNLSNAEVVENLDDFLAGDDVVLEKEVSLEEDSRAGMPVQPQKTPVLQEIPKGEASDLKRLDNAVSALTERVERLERIVKDLSDKVVALLSVSPEKEGGAGIVTERPKAQAASSGLQAKVADVEGNAVYIWAGTAQGVKEGDVFVIKRDGNIIARVKIDTVSADMSRGQVISKTANVERKTDIAEKE